MAAGSQPRQESPGWFATTHWSVVLQAREGDSPAAARALAQLCQTYWGPINAYIRGRGHPSADAEDLTQQFFARFLEKEHYRLADRERGRFRSFLLTSVKRFVINEWERSFAQKRGGGRLAVSLDEEALEEGHPRVELTDERTAERLYEQNWTLTLLAEVRARLEAEYAAEGKGERFAQLEQFLPGEKSDLTYAEAAARFGVAEGTIKSDMHRLKRRYRELLREQIAHTVAAPSEIDEELRHLIAVLGRA